MIYSIYITAKDKKEAHKISRRLLDKKMIACANIFPIESIYFWEGRLAEENEYAVIAKTGRLFNEIEKEIRKVHSYKIPCICRFNVQANKDFEKWVKKRIKEK